jgi:DNA mismatch repair ATPase MutS
MEETLSVLTHGSEKSLAIIDELGRGTSTFDGMAIAYSVLIDLI